MSGTLQLLMKVFLATILVIMTFVINGQVTGPEQDCGGAIPVCDATYNQMLSYSGTGSIDDIMGNSKCLQNNENNSVWYIFTVGSGGLLEFTINPNNSGPNGDDYDFALYNITGKSCSDIGNDTLEVRCNYAFTNGPTGLKTGYTSTVAGPGDSAFLAPLSVLPDQTFALVVDNFSSSSDGYTLDLTPSSADVVDNVLPYINSVDSLDCDNTSSIKLTFSEPVLCDSLQSDGSGFMILSPSGNIVPITGISSVNCSNGSFTTIATITLANPITDGGTYTLISRDGAFTDNCIKQSEGDTILFFVPDVVNADFSYTVKSSCVADTFTFQNESTGNYNPASIFWDFGDTDTSTLDAPVHLYSVKDTYTVKLTVSSAHCTDTYVDNNIIVTNSFRPKITYDPKNPCVGDVVNFKDASNSTATDFFWNFGDTNIAGGSSASNVYSNPGNYKVLFWMIDRGFGCVSDTLEEPIKVRETISADFTYDGVACEDAPFHLRDTSTGAPKSWFWEFGDGNTSTEQNPFHTFRSTGMFSVQLSVVDSFCGPTDSITKNIEVRMRPVFDLGNDTGICVLETVILSAYPSAEQYVWSTGENTPFIEFDNAPDEVWATAFLNGCNYSDTIAIAANGVDDCSFVWVPKAFTPNNDGKNDIFRIFTKRVEEYEMTIFNRWGEQIIKFGNTDFGWDGSYKDEIQNMGTYTYLLEWKAISGETFTKMGSVTLIR